MTIIVPIKFFIHPRHTIYGLASDLVYSPFSDPSIMNTVKIFQGDDFVWGVTGDISIINVEAIEANTFEQFKLQLRAGVADSIIVVSHGDQVFTYDCNQGRRTWSNATFTGEPLSWGCFRYAFNAKFDRYLVHDADCVYEWIYNLHSLYGFKPEDDFENADIKFNCIKFSREDIKKRGFFNEL